MTAPLTAVEDWAASLLERIGPRQRAQLAMQLARKLRQSNQQRMRRQEAPDGSAWELRKPPARTLREQGRKLREPKQGPMMRKLAAAKYLRTSATAAEAVVEFADRVQRIAVIHHFGQTGAVNYPNPPMYEYPARPLIGISDDDLQSLQALIFKHLQG